MRVRLMPALAMLVLLVAWLSNAEPAVAQEAAAAEITVAIDGEYGYWLPPDVSKNGWKVDRLIDLVHWFMAVLFVGWGIFFVYCLLRFRQRSGHKASSALVKAKVSKWSEIAVAAIEAVLLLGFSIPIWASVKNELPTEADNPLHVRVVAEQFAWNFHYAGPNGVFGKTAPGYINAAINPLGIDPNDPNGEDDIVSGELHIVVERPVIAEVTSKDVIHSFSVPVMRVKQDAIPGMRIPVWFEAVKSGNYEVACAQLCGNNHYSMKALMVIHNTQQEFDEWLESQVPEEFDEEEFD